MSYTGTPELSAGEQEEGAFRLQHRIADFLLIDPYDDTLIAALRTAVEGDWGTVQDPVEPQAVLGRHGVEPLEPEIWQALEQDIAQPPSGEPVRYDDFFREDNSQLRDMLIAGGNPFTLVGTRDDREYTETWYPLHEGASRLPAYYCQTKDFNTTELTGSCILLPGLPAMPPLEVWQP